ncbi:hypothetical protein MtrunA17_Chr4g0037181 [Medicago truncatula]|uniref:Uncharacterized protein n=1 Tax=Medicago truncatula TaxID=3880 RepID=A0A396I794_MEDTR|nr:hypothetical protein MtrunA17_Chr4g0037181 [Medicago truncatula]
MGMNVVTLKEPKRFTLDLLKTMDPNDTHNEKLRGQIVVELTYKRLNEEEAVKGFDETQTIPKAPEGTPAGGGQLVVTVLEAQDVEGKYQTNPQACLIFRGEEKKTKVDWRFVKTAKNIARPIIEEPILKYKVDSVEFQTLTLRTLPPTFFNISLLQNKAKTEN